MSEPTQRELELELDLWVTQLNLAQSTMMNCQLSARDLDVQIKARQALLKQRADDAVAAAAVPKE